MQSNDFLIDSIEPKPQYERLPSGGLLVRAPAKINLNLLVGTVRDDGYHPLDSYVAKVTLYDEIRLRPAGAGEVSLRCEGIDCGPAEENLALRAARLLGESRPDAGVAVELIKRIPPGAGLGGGSSDAAAVLLGLDLLWRLELPVDVMIELAVSLGSDVPLFLAPAALRMTGRGEFVEPVDVHEFFAVLLMPGVHCSTGAVYRALDELPRPSGDFFARQRPSALLREAPSRWCGLLENDLLAPAEAVAPRIGSMRKRFSMRTGLPAHLTGSGSAMFVLCDSHEQAVTAGRGLDDDLRGRSVIVRMNPW